MKLWSFDVRSGGPSQATLKHVALTFLQFVALVLFVAVRSLTKLRKVSFFMKR